MAALNNSDVAAFKRGIAYVKTHPEALHSGEYAFVKEYLIGLGARIPVAPKAKVPESKAESQGHSHTSKKSKSNQGNQHKKVSDDDVDEAEGDLDGLEDKPFVWKDTEGEDPIEEDKSPEVETVRDVVDEKLHVAPDLDKEITLEAEEEADTIKSKGQELLLEGKMVEALSHFIKAAELNPTAPNYASRADVFLRLKQPLAAIKDATIALTINPESIKAKKVRGKAVCAQLAIALDCSLDCYPIVCLFYACACIYVSIVCSTW
jgi:suppressor of tumorigenicity protein 13